MRVLKIVQAINQNKIQYCTLNYYITNQNIFHGRFDNRYYLSVEQGLWSHPIYFEHGYGATDDLHIILRCIQVQILLNYM